MIHYLKYSVCTDTVPYVITSRVSQYVYVPTRDHLFQTLDLHADTLEGDVKLPLVLLGYEGKLCVSFYVVIISFIHAPYSNVNSCYDGEVKSKCF